MLFNSYIFILFFLPLSIIIYFLLNKYAYGKSGQAGLVWLFGMSLWFYGYEKPVYLLLILTSIGFNFLLTRRMGQKKGGKRRKQLLLAAGLLFNLGLLFYFKYYNFFLDNAYRLMARDWEWKNIFLPLGISFFTFQQISFVIDCYKADGGISYSFVEYAAFVSFFPQLVAGPIVMHSELVPQFRDKAKKRIDYDNLAKGLYGFTLGLGKKVLIADTLSKLVTAGFQDVNALNSGSALLVMLAYTLQIYFDFSGYSDMALGMAAMFNIELPVNFHSPYKAKTIGEFWERWHMTLTRFFTQYVYIPLGGSRKGKIRTYFNTLVVFLLSGLWHGANWTFVIWGGLHGLLLTLEKIIRDIGGNKEQKSKKSTGTMAQIGKRLWGVCIGGLTFLFVNVAWVLFRAASMEEAKLFLQKLLSGGFTISEKLLAPVEKLIEVRLVARLGFGGFFEQYPVIPLAVILLLLLLGVFFMKNTQEKMGEDKYRPRRSLVTIILLVWCVISLSDVSEFLYFNF
ncbi:MAG: MBOAT family O-acyltransferase [Lachnospiraceae bacterium]